MVRGLTGSLAVLGAALALTACGGSGARVPHHANAIGLHAHAGGGRLPAAAAGRTRFASDQALPATGVASAQTSGRITSYIGFNPSRDGFSFQNYGFVAGADLDARAMRELFGDQVCASAPSDSCTLTPAAANWAQSADGQAYGGHCFGFSFTALRFFRRDPSPAAYGASTTYGLAFSRAVQSEIAADFMTQLLTPVQQESREFSPAQIIPFLQQAMADANRGGELYGLEMYSSATHDGHAITPIGLEDLGGGRWYILVYDNNKPNTVQGISVDTNADTWSYMVAINPQQQDAVWHGQGQDNKLILTPLSAVTGRQPCPFCGGPSAAGATETISLAGDPVHHAHLLITSGGRRLGIVGGRLVDEIPGARVIRPVLSDVSAARPDPVYVIPARDHVLITVQPGGVAGSVPSAVYVSGPGFGDRVTGLQPGRASGAQIALGAGGTSLSLRLTGAGPAARPTLAVARDHGRGGQVISATPAALPAGAALTVGVHDAAGRALVHSTGSSAPVVLTVSAVGAGGVRTVSRRASAAGHSLSLGLIRIG